MQAGSDNARPLDEDFAPGGARSGTHPDQGGNPSGRRSLSPFPQPPMRSTGIQDPYANWPTAPAGGNARGYQHSGLAGPNSGGPNGGQRQVIDPYGGLPAATRQQYMNSPMYRGNMNFRGGFTPIPTGRNPVPNVPYVPPAPGLRDDLPY
jgi:hypothetical protein